MDNFQKKNVSLVLSSGGARGLSQIGVIEEIEKHGYTITSISGCSIGALVGGVYAAGKLNPFKEWALGLSKRDILRLMDISFSRKGFLKADKVFEKISPFIGQKSIENLPISFSAVATDIYNNKEVVFTKGSLSKAIRSSVAIPIFIHPGVVDSTILVDGGVVNPLPINRVKRTENDIVIAVNVNDLDEENPIYKSSFKKYIPKKQTPKEIGLIDIMSMSFELQISKLVEYSISENNPDLVIHIPRNCAKTYEFYATQKLIEMGTYAAKIAIEKYEEKQNLR